MLKKEVRMADAEGRSSPAVATPLGAEEASRWGKASAAPEAARFLQGPQPRGFELARALRIFFELMRGFRTLHFVGPCVSVFGSAQFSEQHPYYALARDVGA